MRLLRVTNVRDVIHLREEWNDLARLNATMSIFLIFEYVFHWYDHYCNGESTYLLLVFSDKGRLIGVAPLYIQIEKRFLLQRRVLKFAGSNVACAEYLDFVIQRGNEKQVMKELFDYIWADRKHWDRLMLTDLQQSSNFIVHMRDLVTPLTPAIHDNRMCLYTELPRTWTEFEATLSNKHLKKVRYYERRLNREASLETGVFKDVEDGMADLYRVHQNRWGDKGMYGSFTSSTARDFNLALAKALQKAGYLRLYYLRYDGVVTAVLYCFLYEKRLYFYNGGFDPKYAKYNVSTVLIKHSIEDAIHSKCTEYDFLRGKSPYKYDWGARERTQVSWAIERRTIPNISMNLIQSASHAANVAIAWSVPATLRTKVGAEMRKFKSRSRLYE